MHLLPQTLGPHTMSDHRVPLRDMRGATQRHLPTPGTPLPRSVHRAASSTAKAFSLMPLSESTRNSTTTRITPSSTKRVDFFIILKILYNFHMPMDKDALKLIPTEGPVLASDKYVHALHA